jgi:SAM-dependent methyltransferase
VQTDLFGLHADIEDRHWWFVARRQILCTLARQVVAPAPQTLVVDVGCGTGANAAALAENYACLGVDTSAQAIALASARHPGVPFLCGTVPDSIGDLAGEAALFVMTDVLEHVADDFMLLSSILSRSRPGAHVLVTVPADERLWSEHDVSFGHYRRYDRARLVRIWDGLPVTVRLCSYFNTRLYPVVRTIRFAAQIRGRSAGDHGTDFKMPPAVVNQVLTDTFAGERNRLVRAIDRPGDLGYRRGVSLVAVLRREAGDITPRSRPSTVPADRHIPS